ncbi:hypothetical protein KJ813_08100 [bacterium]|nr:hypothetical protein [bacterium]MBU4362603.1 hypothetical protein [bacterium]MBU4602536.1 hypothetical protein [bacterium]
MILSEEKRTIIINEFNKVHGLMNNTNDISEKLFYFSASHAMVSRVFNIEFDPLLILIHSVLQTTYSNINSFVSNISNKQNMFFTIPKNYFDILENTFKELTQSVENNDDDKIYRDLQKLSILGYIATGNGNYLYKKDLIKL